MFSQVWHTQHVFRIISKYKISQFPEISNGSGATNYMFSIVSPRINNLLYARQCFGWTIRKAAVERNRGQNGDIKIIRGRHPCLEAQDDVNFIPNNYELNRESSRLLVITGPNMGGKSTYIRQLGIIAVMAQIGSFVPADVANLSIVDAVLARSGSGRCTVEGCILLWPRCWKHRQF